MEFFQLFELCEGVWTKLAGDFPVILFQPSGKQGEAWKFVDVYRIVNISKNLSKENLPPYHTNLLLNSNNWNFYR